MKVMSLSALLLISPAYAESLTADNHGEIIYHTNFPVDKSAGNIERLDLSEAKFQPLILSNLVAGVLLAHMIDETYPGYQFDRPYVYGSLFGQLLQENISTAGFPGGRFINDEVQRGQLLAPGQGGPYQLNDYSKRLPGVDTKGSLGLINYTALQGKLGYSIKDQDNGEQTSKVGPQSLDDVYFGPMAAAYFHLNDLNRLDVINQPDWGPEAHSWSMCKTNLKQGKFQALDMILNAAYNAGTYSDILKTTIDLCAYPNELSAYVKKLDDYSLNDTAYIASFQFDKPLADPRQIRYYVDQLQNDNQRLTPYNLAVDNSFSFSAQALSEVFKKSMMTLGYVDGSGKYQLISEKAAEQGFSNALTSKNIKMSTTFNLNNKAEREKAYALIDAAIKQLETKLKFKFNATTEKDYKLAN